MSSIPTQQIDGYVSVGRSVAIGGKAIVRGSATIGHHLKVEGWVDAPNIKGPLKGLFASPDALRAAYPRPMPGWFALVGNTLPADIWRVDGKEWVYTGEQGGEFNIWLDQIENDLSDLTEEIRNIEKIFQADLLQHETIKFTPTAGGVKIGFDVITTEGEIKSYEVALPVVSDSLAGVITAADKRRLDSLHLSEDQVNTAVELANAANTAAQTALTKAEAAYPPTLTLSQLDTMGTSGLSDNWATILKCPHTRYRLVGDGWNPAGTIPPNVVGFVDVFSDSLRHVITQELTTHYVFDDNGNLISSAHTDTAIRTYYRSFNRSAASDFPVDEGQWTKWQEKVPEGLRSMVYEAMTIAKKALELSQTGSPTVEFSGFVSSVQLQPMSVSMASTDPGYCAVFDSTRKTFLLKSASGSYYNNWGDADRFGTASVDGRIPDTGKIYADTVSGNWYRWDGTNLVKFNSGVADPGLKDTIITNEEIDDLIESLGDEETATPSPSNPSNPGENGGNNGGAEENGQPGVAVPGDNDESGKVTNP